MKLHAMLNKIMSSNLAILMFSIPSLAIAQVPAEPTAPKTATTKPSLEHSAQKTSLEAALVKNPKSLKTRVQLADIYTREKHFEKVVELLNPYTDLLDNDTVLLLANAYSNQGDSKNEIRVLKMMTVKKPNDFRWHMLLAQAYIKYAPTITDPVASKNAEIDGIEELRTVLSPGMQPKYKPAFDLLLQTLLKQKAHHEARELIVEGINKFGNRPELFKEICRLNSMDAFLDQAVRDCRAAINLAPNFPDNYVYLAQALHDQTEKEQAEKVITNAARKFPKSEFVQWAAGKLAYLRNSVPVASRYYREAVSANPNSGRSQFGLAQSLFEIGSYKEALEHFIKACEFDATSLDTFLAAGTKLKHMTNPDYQKQKDLNELGQKYMYNANTCRK